MRKAIKNVISLTVVLIAGLNFIVPAFAQDPFTAVAVGGVSGASGAGLFSSMAGASGINIDWTNQSVDEINAMWNVLNPDHVLFTGEKHEATNVGEDVYDYITVDINDWLRAQTNFIKSFETINQVSDYDSGTTQNITSFRGIPFVVDNNTKSASLATTENVIQANSSYSLVNGPFRVDFSVGNKSYGVYKGAGTFYYLQSAVGTFQNTNIYEDYYHLRIGYISNNPTQIRIFLTRGTQMTGPQSNVINGTPVSNNTDWTSGTVNTDIFNGWEGAKVKIPTAISQLQTGWTLPDFLNELDRIWTGAGEDNIIIENDNVVPPSPIPDTPLGDVPFDDWVDLWGQSIWDNLTRIEEKAELMVINQNDGLESIDDLEGLGEDILEGTNDLVGLATDIDENLEDMITYEQGISEDVEDIGENVEDIEDEVIIIVDEMGNVIDVLEGIDAKIYAQGQTIGSISTEVGTVADAAEAIQTEVEAQTESQEDILEAVEDLVPYVVPLPDIAADTETMVDILPDIATATQTSTQTLTDTLPDIKDATETITETLPDIITEIQDATTTLTDEIPNIDDICLNIDEAPYKDLETGVDRLPRFMLPFITDLRSALGIWHYVTEWLAQISTTFAFITGCLVGTSIMTPIYAAIAGFMCIKIYRRMCS